MGEETKVSSEKDVAAKPKRQYKKREKKPTQEDVVATENNSVEEFKAQIAMLKAELEKRDAETKRLLELSERALNSSDSPGAGTVMVKCLEINGVELSSPNRDVIITLPYDVWVECEINELSQIFKRLSNRTLFEDGVCVMGEEGLERFRIKVKNTINFEEIVDLLNEGNAGKIRNLLDKFTSNKKKDSIMHLILYTIVGKSLDGELNRVPRTSIETLEGYFGVKLKDAEMLLKIFRKVKN